MKAEGKSSEVIKHAWTATKNKCKLKGTNAFSKVQKSRFISSHILGGNKSFYSVWPLSGGSEYHILFTLTKRKHQYLG